jgi:uncharacterized protein YndB with AHSA1/START domain
VVLSRTRLQWSALILRLWWLQSKPLPFWSAPQSTAWSGKFKTKMAARDKSSSFNFMGTYTVVRENELIAYDPDDGRQVRVEFIELPEGVSITESFEPENQYPEEIQRSKWQAILDNFKKYVESIISK